MTEGFTERELSTVSNEMLAQCLDLEIAFLMIHRPQEWGHLALYKEIARRLRSN